MQKSKMFLLNAVCVGTITIAVATTIYIVHQHQNNIDKFDSWIIFFCLLFSLWAGSDLIDFCLYPGTDEENNDESNDMPPIDLVDALIIGHKQWIWLAENPSKRKHDWPLYNIIKSINGCICCRYDDQFDFVENTGCPNCPLSSLWPRNTKRQAIKHTECTSSFFNDWAVNVDDYYDRSFFALCIAEAFEQRLIDFDYSPKVQNYLTESWFNGKRC